MTAPAAGMGAMQRILIVDDSAAARQQVVDCLAHLDQLALVTASNGIEALRLLRDTPYDLLICDFEMPRMNGLQVVRAVRSWASSLELPILLVTGRTGVHDKATVLQAGANDYVTKPVDPTELVARVTAHLRISYLRKELERAQAQAAEQQKLLAVGRLAGGMAHEINTPTQYMNSNLEFMRDGFAALLKMTRPSDDLTDKEQRRLAFLEREMPGSFSEFEGGLRHITAIVSAVKRFSDLSDQEHHPSDVNRVLREATRTAESNTPTDVAVELRLATSLPLLKSSALVLTEAFLHIIQNARRAVRDKGHGSVSVKSELVDAAILVTVEDTGAGIAPENRPRIFDPFFTTREVGDGLGYGLALVWAAIVNEHHGEITFESTLREGTTFFIRLPLH